MNEIDKAKNLLLGYSLININDEVEVKLTDIGRDIYFHRYDELNKINNNYFKQKYPKEINGWFKEQLWIIMEIFGRHMLPGISPPFIEIRIKEK